MYGLFTYIHLGSLGVHVGKCRLFKFSVCDVYLWLHQQISKKTVEVFFLEGMTLWRCVFFHEILPFFE